MNKSLFFVVAAVIALLALTTVSVSFSEAFSVFVGPSAPATLETSASFFNKITAQVIPEINQLARNLVIPAGGSEKQHFTYDAIRFSSFDLGPLEFVFNSLNEVEVRMTELKFSVPSTEFHLYDRIIFELHCAGHFDVSAALSASFKMNLVDNGGKLGIAGTTDVSIDYQSFDPHLKFDHFLCKLGGDIIGLFTGGISNLIKKLVEKDLAPGIQKALTGALEKAFAKLPVELTGNPRCVGGALQIPINLDSLVKSAEQHNNNNNNNNVHQNMNKMSLIKSPPRLSSFSSRDIGIILPDTSVNTVINTLNSLHKLGPFNTTDMKLTTDLFKLLLPEAYNRCENCPLNFKVDFRHSPSVIFSSNNATLEIQNLTLDIHAVNHSTMIPLFTLGLTTYLSIDNFTVSGTQQNTIHFDLGLQTLQFSQISSSVGNLPVSALNLIGDLIKNVLIPDFNKNSKGLDLNNLLKGTNITVSEVEIDLTSTGIMKAGLDVSIHA